MATIVQVDVLPTSRAGREALTSEPWRIGDFIDPNHGAVLSANPFTGPESPIAGRAPFRGQPASTDVLCRRSRA